MASAGNPNQPGQFDMQKLFKPSSNPNHPNQSSPPPPFSPTPYPTPSSPSPSSSSSSSSAAAAAAATTTTTTSSYPPLPSSSSGGPFSYPPQTSPFHHPQHHNHLPYPPPPPPSLLLQQDQQLQLQLQLPIHQRPISSFANPSSSSSVHPPPPHSQLSSPNNNHSARLMALINSNAPSNNLDLPPPSPMPPPPPPPTASTSSSSSPPEYNNNNNNMSMNSPPIPSAPPVNLSIPPPTPSRMHSTKPPKGRHLMGDHVLYDVDVRFQGEIQPQLEVTPITKYGSDPGLVLGRQIAVNRTYICYGLKMGQIRVLNINTASRSLLRGLFQRVTDMAFFAEDVHLLASASVDGRVFVWKINEGPDEEHKPQITGQIIIAVQIVGEGESVYPRVCWHSHKQEVLVVGIGKRILKIDTTKVGKGETFSAEEPLKCHIDKLIDGVQFVGKHDGEVTDLSMCQWMTTRLVSASKDGTVKIWEDRKPLPLAVLRPHDGQPVNSVTFLTSPHRPDHIILITAGPLNREMKIWSSASQEGWLLPSDAESWQCTQTLELKSSAEPRVEEAFFNQVIALPRAGLILLANAKKNAIYAVHIEYGPYPSATRMDYIAEFTVTMPILSLTGTSDSLPDGDHIVQVYCVQTQAIQQYALDLSQCLPPPLENIGLEKTESNVSRAFEISTSDGFDASEPVQGNQLPEMIAGSAVPKQIVIMSYPKRSTAMSTSRYPNISNASDSTRSNELDTSSLESRQILLPPASSINESIHTASPPRPLSPRLSGKLSGFRSPSNSFEPSSPHIDHGVDQPVLDYSVDRGVDTVPAIMPDAPNLDDNARIGGNKILQNEIPMVNSPTMFKPPTHLITPAEILSRAVSSSDSTQFSQGITAGEAKIQDVVVDNGVENVEVEVKVVGEAGLNQRDEVGHHREPYVPVTERREKSFCSQASDLNVEMARECCALSTGTYSVETQQLNDARVTEAPDRTSASVEEKVQDSSKDMPGNVSEIATAASVPQSTPAAKGKKQKVKNPQVSGPSSPSPSPFNSADSSNEPGRSSSAVQKTLNQLLAMQIEMQKQMVANMASPAKEGKRLEASLGKSMEKTMKLNNDALWARFQEDNVKNDKLGRDRVQQIINVITNCMSKDLPSMLDRTLKKELASVGQSVARQITPSVEKSISSAITDSFQRGVGDKAVNQLEKSVNSKLEATVARQIQAQFQTSGKQAIQDSLRSCLEATVVPAFEMSCKSMFEQVDSAFQKGMVEHTTAAQQQFDSTHSPLALALRETINSASSITQTLTGELADGQRKLLALAAAGANSKAVNPLVTQLSNGPLGGLHEMVEVPLDPTKELSRLVSERKFEDAFTAALQRSDVSIVSWLCSQVDLQGILSTSPLPLSQGVLLALLQQLACDINKEMSRKLTWMTEVACAINPADPMIALHVRPIFEQVYQILSHQRNLPNTGTAEGNSIRLVMHVINSMLMSCK